MYSIGQIKGYCPPLNWSASAGPAISAVWPLAWVAFIIPRVILAAARLGLFHPSQSFPLPPLLWKHHSRRFTVSSKVDHHLFLSPTMFPCASASICAFVCLCYVATETQGMYSSDRYPSLKLAWSPNEIDSDRNVTPSSRVENYIVFNAHQCSNLFNANHICLPLAGVDQS